MGKGKGDDRHALDLSTGPDLEVIYQQVKSQAARLAQLGNWPEHISPDSILDRIPTPERPIASGFDAGVACCLDLIPRERQEVSAALHAAYTPEIVARVRHELKDLKADHQTAWWLAACSLCKEGEVDAEFFKAQLEGFKALVDDPKLRLQKAKEEYQAMTRRFWLEEGVPFGDEDGCQQGAYLAGYTYAGMYGRNTGLYFIGTYLPSLGLEDFNWSSQVDQEGRPRSGPVHGSRQFVKCHDRDEYLRALEVIKAKLPLESTL